MSTATEAQTAPTTRGRFTVGAPTAIALVLIAAVWVFGAVWSFEEQTHLAKELGFQIPELLPLTLDGMAVAMAAVAFAASLDARPAVYARLITAVAIGASAASNASAAWRRSAGDEQTVILAAGVAVAAMFAFEVLLGEVRRQVLRYRGQPGPVAIVYPRLVRLFLSPWPTFAAWRRLVLDATDPQRDFTDRPPIRVTATVVDESDPDVQVCRRLEREMAAARQSIAPRIARVALAEHAVHWSAVADRPPIRATVGHPESPAPAALPARPAAQPAASAEPVREPVAAETVSLPPAFVEPIGEPVREPVAGSPVEPPTGSPRPAPAAHGPAQRRVTERLTGPAQTDSAKKVAQAHTRLTRRLKREPTNPELAAETGLSLATVKRLKPNPKEQ